jgi:hypothetical protein
MRGRVCVHKVVTEEPQGAHLRHFLDGQQYSVNGILRYERVFGPGFVSTGGLTTTKARAYRQTDAWAGSGGHTDGRMDG